MGRQGSKSGPRGTSESSKGLFSEHAKDSQTASEEGAQAVQRWTKGQNSCFRKKNRECG